MAKDVFLMSEEELRDSASNIVKNRQEQIREQISFDITKKFLSRPIFLILSLLCFVISFLSVVNLFSLRDISSIIVRLFNSGSYLVFGIYFFNIFRFAKTRNFNFTDVVPIKTLFLFVCIFFAVKMIALVIYAIAFNYFNSLETTILTPKDLEFLFSNRLLLFACGFCGLFFIGVYYYFINDFISGLIFGLQRKALNNKMHIVPALLMFVVADENALIMLVNRSSIVSTIRLGFSALFFLLISILIFLFNGKAKSIPPSYMDN